MATVEPQVASAIAGAGCQNATNNLDADASLAKPFASKPLVGRSGKRKCRHAVMTKMAWLEKLQHMHGSRETMANPLSRDTTACR